MGCRTRLHKSFFIKLSVFKIIIIHVENEILRIFVESSSNLIFFS